MICTFKNYNLFCVIYDKNWPLSVAGEIAQIHPSLIPFILLNPFVPNNSFSNKNI